MLGTSADVAFSPLGEVPCSGASDGPPQAARQASKARASIHANAFFMFLSAIHARKYIYRLFRGQVSGQADSGTDDVRQNAPPDTQQGSPADHDAEQTAGLPGEGITLNRTSRAIGADAGREECPNDAQKAPLAQQDMVILKDKGKNESL